MRYTPTSGDSPAGSDARRHSCRRDLETGDTMQLYRDVHADVGTPGADRFSVSSYWSYDSEVSLGAPVT